MAGVPINFAVPGEGTVASYNWTDISSATGFVSYNLCSMATSSATTYHLITNNIYSKTIGTTGGNGENIDLTFKTSTFKKPATISGTAFLSLGTGIYKYDTGGGAATCYFTITLSLVSSGTTTLHTGNTDTILGTSTGSGVFNAILYPMEISKTNVKIGDYIQLRIQSVVGGTYPQIAIGHDPKNRDHSIYIIPSTNANAFTNSTLNIPFKIDI